MIAWKRQYTKPTGQGTGLGLSLSYDIVKAHGGEIKVESKEGEGTEFMIQLPIAWITDHTDWKITRNNDVVYQTKYGMKSAKSLDPCKSVIQQSYDIIKAHLGEIKLDTKDG